MTDLKQCSLVCLFWANRCRSYMFSERTLQIKSYEDAEIFRRYVVGGCPRLTPVHQFIRKIQVGQNYKSQRSFLHLVYLPAIQDKLQSFSITGPVPVDFNRAKLDTPHWDIPTYIVVPSSLLKEIVLKNIHFPSFRHVTKYMRHFTCATYIYFEGITWDGQTPTYSLPHAFSTIPGQRRPRSLIINAWNGCTDSVHLALTALMLNPNCPLRRLSDEERVWIINFMTLLWGHKKNLYVFIGFEVSEQVTTMELQPFHLVFEETPPTDRSASTLSVVGMHAYILHPDDFPTNFDALVNHARTQPTIRALVVLFQSLDHLQQFMKPFVALATENIELVLTYEKEEEEEEVVVEDRKAVGVDLVTLEPNGRVWADLPRAYGWRNSVEILRRELKKRR